MSNWHCFSVGLYSTLLATTFLGPFAQLVNIAVVVVVLKQGRRTGHLVHLAGLLRLAICGPEELLVVSSREPVQRWSTSSGVIGRC